MIVGVVAIKGGVGRSTLSVHLAGWLARFGHGVIFVDADPQAAATRWLGDALPELRVEPAHDPDELLGKIPVLAQATDHVVVDGPPGSAEASRAILLVCDLAILPCGPSVLDFRGLRATVELARSCERVSKGTPELSVVLNRMRPQERVSGEVFQAVTALRVPVARTVIRQRTAIADSVGRGRLLSQLGTAAWTAADDMDRLFGEVFRARLRDRAPVPR